MFCWADGGEWIIVEGNDGSKNIKTPAGTALENRKKVFFKTDVIYFSFTHVPALMNTKYLKMLIQSTILIQLIRDVARLFVQLLSSTSHTVDVAEFNDQFYFLSAGSKIK